MLKMEGNSEPDRMHPSLILVFSEPFVVSIAILQPDSKKFQARYRYRQGWVPI